MRNELKYLINYSIFRFLLIKFTIGGICPVISTVTSCNSLMITATLAVKYVLYRTEVKPGQF